MELVSDALPQLAGQTQDFFKFLIRYSSVRVKQL